MTKQFSKDRMGMGEFTALEGREEGAQEWGINPVQEEGKSPF